MQSTSYLQVYNRNMVGKIFSDEQKMEGREGGREGAWVTRLVVVVVVGWGWGGGDGEGE